MQHYSRRCLAIMNRPIQKNNAGFACLLYVPLNPHQKPGGWSSFQIRLMSKTPQKKTMNMNIANSSTTSPTPKKMDHQLCQGYHAHFSPPNFWYKLALTKPPSKAVTWARSLVGFEFFPILFFCKAKILVKDLQKKISLEFVWLCVAKMCCCLKQRYLKGPNLCNESVE